LKEEAYNICRQPYWERIWIVQEIGTATELRIHWGHNLSQPWDKLFETLQQSRPAYIESAAKLARQREGRHGDGFMLANLIEVCQDSLCEEPRDRIYGFVGIAHDCQGWQLSDGLFQISLRSI
jgi:hypothetical protein